MVKAALVKGEIEAGPLTIGAGLTADTGFVCGSDGFGLYFLGNGMTIGPKFDISAGPVSLSIDFTKIFG